MPNKEGGYAPNSTPACLPDNTQGFIVDSNVPGCVNETKELIPAVDHTTEMLGEKQDNVLTDVGNAAGSVLAGLEKRGITAFAQAMSQEVARLLNLCEANSILPDAALQVRLCVLKIRAQLSRRTNWQSRT